MKNLAAAIAAFQEKAPQIKLDKKVKIETRAGKKIDFGYASLGQILDKIRKPMKEAGLTHIQTIKDGKLITTLFHVESGESIESELILPTSTDVKNIGASITYWRRYELTAMLGLVGEEDNDAPEDVSKPVMNGKQLEQAKEAILSGDKQILEKCLDNLVMTGFQVRELVKAEIKKEML